MAPELQYADIRSLRAAYGDGSLLPSEHLAATFALLDRWEPRIGAFLTLARERATAEAEAADRLLHRYGKAVWADRPLLGMPVSVKDLTPTEGIRTTRGSLLYADAVPDRDAPAVARLRAAGALVIGKTNTTEGGWSAAGVNRLQGPTRNPWDPARTPGGSSAGAAASVAVGIGVGATGTDGAGSIRIPASFCGVVGFKPSLGRIPYVPQSPEELSHLGPLTRTVADAALLTQVMSGYDAGDPLSFGVPGEPTGDPEAAAGRLPRLRIGWIPSLGDPAPQPGIAATVLRAVEALAARGHTVEEIPPPFEDPYPALETILAGWEAAAHARDLDEVADRLDPGRLEVIRYGRGLSAARLARAYEARAVLRARSQALMERYDLLAMPTVAIEPFAAELHEPPDPVRKGALSWLAWAPEAYTFNLTGQPAVSVPAGRSPGGLPVGLQLVGGRHDDLRVLAAAYQLEQAHPWHHEYAALTAPRPETEGEPT
ncbi:amidase family protein [Streptomyces sp. A1547]|uniref:amidase n=1 Tax=Streptomyces sp. A1547 TaxID=2563105 RepID=UPI00109EDC1F|nr:amidase family protein [Streptomyces sp. A1547]THA38489.1 amidase [Streptomyces sp. A1547]